MKIRRLAGVTFLLALATALTACGPRDLHIDRDEWAALSPEEQAAIQAEYQEMVDAQRDFQERTRIRGQTRTLTDRGIGVRPESNNPVKDCCI